MLVVSEEDRPKFCGALMVPQIMLEFYGTKPTFFPCVHRAVVIDLKIDE